MSKIEGKSVFVFTITALSHPDNLLTPTLKAYSEVDGDGRKFQNSPAQQMNILDIYKDDSTTKQKITIIQPLGTHLIDKMPSRHYKTIDGMIILFSNEIKGSFQAAKTFYRILRKENSDNSVPVVFVEMCDENNPLADFEPEFNDDSPSVIYYTISQGNLTSFHKVVNHITDQYTLKNL